MAELKKLEVVWQDHHSVAGWHETAHIEEDVLLNTSVGFLVKENKHHLSLAQTVVSDGEQCGDLIHILVKNIIEKRELS